MRNNRIWFIPAIAVTLGIFLLSTFLAFPMQVEGVGYLDKIEHCFAYAVLVISFLLAFKKVEGLTKRKIYLLIFWASIYGFSLELVQFVFLSYRFFEWKDALANLLGIFSGLAIFKLFDRG